MPGTNLELPVYPIVELYLPDQQQVRFDNPMELAGTVEFYDSDNTEYASELILVDAKGRRCRAVIEAHEILILELESSEPRPEDLEAMASWKHTDE